MSLTKYSLIILGLFIFIYIFKWWSLLPIGLIVLIILIRWLADVYWDLKDKGKLE